MKHIYNFLFIFLFIKLIIFTAQGQDVVRPFKPNIFKYSEKELPITFGISGGIGPSTEVIGGGANLNMDIFHIFIGYRVITSPIFTLGSAPDFYEDKAYYFGYRYRKNKFELAIGSGFGKTYFRECKGGDMDGCANSEEGTYQTTPLIVEYSFFPVAYIGGSSSLNIVFNGNRTALAILAGIKIGISRRLKKEN